MVLSLKSLFLNEADQISKTFEMAVSSAELADDFRLCGPIFVEAVLKSQTGTIFFSAKVSFEAVHPCDRCLEDVKDSYRYFFEHKVVRSLSDDSEDYIVAENDELDLKQLLLEDISLNLPTKVLCFPDCKGMCPVCGENLNKHSCGCNKDRIDPRLAVLKQLID